MVIHLPPSSRLSNRRSIVSSAWRLPAYAIAATTFSILRLLEEGDSISSHAAQLPDKLTKTINSSFTRDQSKNWTKKSGTQDSDANMNFFDVLKGGGSNKSSYSTDELQEVLKERGIYAEVEGEMWVVRSIKLVQLNTSVFDKMADVYFESKTIDSETKMSEQPADLSLSVSGDIPDERRLLRCRDAPMNPL